MIAQPKNVLLDEAQSEEYNFLEECSHAELRERIRVELLAHLALIGIDPSSAVSDRLYTKELVRTRHAAQRAAFRVGEQQFLDRYGRSLLSHFAEGHEILPEAVDPQISLVVSGTEDAALFRLSILKSSGRIGINCGMIYVIRALGRVQTVQKCFAAGISRRLLQIFSSRTTPCLNICSCGQLSLKSLNLHATGWTARPMCV
jgi:hypothetical protein